MYKVYINRRRVYLLYIMYLFVGIGVNHYYIKYAYMKTMARQNSLYIILNIGRYTGFDGLIRIMSSGQANEITL